MKRLDLTNQRFGRLVAVSPVRHPTRPRFNWRCRCDCGGEYVAQSDSLRVGRVRSCGCLRQEAAKRAGAANITHGKTGTRAFRIWQGMLSRCYYSGAVNFKDYGGRGIYVCQRWENFRCFLEDMGEPPTPKHQIDRIDVNAHYEPDNCHWVLPKENARNKRSSHFIEFNGSRKTITEWAESIGITAQGLRRRIYVLGWPIDAALTKGAR